MILTAQYIVDNIIEDHSGIVIRVDVTGPLSVKLFLASGQIIGINGLLARNIIYENLL